MKIYLKYYGQSCVKNKLENGFNISHSSEEILTNVTLTTDHWTFRR